MSTYDEQRDIEAEGQRAAIYHQNKHKKQETDDERRERLLLRKKEIEEELDRIPQWGAAVSVLNEELKGIKSALTVYDNTIPVYLPGNIKQAIDQLEEATKELAFVGSQPPEDRDAIEEDHATARHNLEKEIAKHLRK